MDIDRKQNEGKYLFFSSLVAVMSNWFPIAPLQRVDSFERNVNRTLDGIHKFSQIVNLQSNKLYMESRSRLSARVVYRLLHAE